VFALQSITNAFVHAWQGLTGAVPVSKPYYNATLVYCTVETLSGRNLDANDGISLASDSDMPEVASLCKAFAATSVSALH
jgi:hypothetical protein